jgi:hypothetical protein
MHFNCAEGWKSWQKQNLDWNAPVEWPSFRDWMQEARHAANQMLKLRQDYQTAVSKDKQ